MNKPVAFMCVRNEADILPWTIRHLIDQGIGVYVIDNWSTDGSDQIAQNFPLEGFERWPMEGDRGRYEWARMLGRVEELAAASSASWCILHDADEIRRSNRPGERMIDALTRIDAAGYNAADHRVMCFHPVDNSYQADPEAHFRYFSEDGVDNRLAHVKAWKNIGRVSLAATGGHQAQFAGRKVSPEKLILKHYPIRSQSHGERKVMQDRQPRYLATERAQNWHVQYDGYVGPAAKFLKHPAGLREDRRPTTIVTLTRFPDIFAAFAESVERHEPSCRRIVVTSGGVRIDRPGWEEISGVEPFNFARNLNLGINAAGTDDVLCVNDDVQFVEPVVERLARAAYAGAAVVSPQIIGDGINSRIARASHPMVAEWERTGEYIPFVCVLLRRAALDSIGLLDESFAGYGGEDNEFGLRAMRRGWHLAVSSCRVKHGYGVRTYSSSFLRVMSDAQRNCDAQANMARAGVIVSAS